MYHGKLCPQCMLIQVYVLADLRSQLLQDNGTVQVVNTATQGNFSIDIVGTATPVDSAYGAGGAFAVNFPGTPTPECPGPNYIVQGMRDIEGRNGICTSVLTKGCRLCCRLGDCADTELEHVVHS